MHGGWSISCLVELHNKYGHSAKSDPTSKLRQIILGILLFADDWNLSITGEKYETVKRCLTAHLEWFSTLE